MAFTNSSELFLGSLILYHGARQVERATGSRKFAVFLGCMALMHSVLSLVYAFAITNAVHLLSSSTTYAFSEQFRSGYLPAGPFGILGALVYQYYALCPPLWTIGVLDAEMTDRMLVGIPMILLATSQPPFSCFSVLLGLLASRMYSLTWPLQVPVRIAGSVQRACRPLIGTDSLPMRASHAQYRESRSRR